MLKSETVQCLITGYSSILHMCSSVWLLQTPKARVLIDNGEKSCREQLLAALNARGLAPGQIDYMVYTHLHLDHCWNHGLFSNALVYISAREQVRLQNIARLLQSRMGNPAEFIQRFLGLETPVPSKLFKRNLDFFLQDNMPKLILESALISEKELGCLGLTCLPSPGHTFGHTAYLWTDGRQNYLFAGDAIFHQTAFRNEKVRMLFNEDLGQYLASKTKLENFRGWICPGHGESFFAE